MQFEFDEFSITMSNLKKRMFKNMTMILKPHDLSGMHAMYLLRLWHEEQGLTLMEMTRQLRMHRANTTRVVRDLVQKGYAVCDKTQEGQRKYKVRLTELGSKVAEELHVGMEAVRDETKKKLTDEEWKTLLSLLNKLAD